MIQADSCTLYDTVSSAFLIIKLEAEYELKATYFVLGCDGKREFMKIIRVEDSYKDLFDKQVLEQHLAFVVEENENIYTYSFQIIGIQAIVFYEKETYIYDVIEEFRFYSGFVTKFYRRDHSLIYSYDEVTLIKYPIIKLMPSQFYIDEMKLKSVSNWIVKEEDIKIPVRFFYGNYIILDGHTRISRAIQLGYESIYIYEEIVDDCIIDFYHMAQERGIKSPYDLPIISHEEYKIKWHKFCDDYFEGLT